MFLKYVSNFRLGDRGTPDNLQAIIDLYTIYKNNRERCSSDEWAEINVKLREKGFPLLEKGRYIAQHLNMFLYRQATSCSYPTRFLNILSDKTECLYNEDIVLRFQNWDPNRCMWGIGSITLMKIKRYIEQNIDLMKYYQDIQAVCSLGLSSKDANALVGEELYTITDIMEHTLFNLYNRVGYETSRNIYNLLCSMNIEMESGDDRLIFTMGFPKEAVEFLKERRIFTLENLYIRHGMRVRYTAGYRLRIPRINEVNKILKIHGMEELQ